MMHQVAAREGQNRSHVTDTPAHGPGYGTKPGNIITSPPYTECNYGGGIGAHRSLSAKLWPYQTRLCLTLPTGNVHMAFLYPRW
jgi:hypothetical protein